MSKFESESELGLELESELESSKLNRMGREVREQGWAAMKKGRYWQGDQRCPPPAPAHGEKRTTIGPSREVGPKTGTSKATMEKQRQWEGDKHRPPTQDWSIQDTPGEVTPDWIIQGSRAMDWEIQGSQGQAKAVKKETNAALSVEWECP